MTKLLLWDLDGTLSDDSQRQHHYLNKNWSEYFSYDAQMADPVYPQALALYNEMLASGWTMGYLTARLERNRQATVDWLILHGFENPDGAIMRPEEDYLIRPPRFKSMVVGNLLSSGHYDDVVLVDNDPLVVERVSDDLGSAHVFQAMWDANRVDPEEVLLVPEL
jgi:hypothetical protein